MKTVYVWLSIFLSGYGIALLFYIGTVLTPVPFGDLTRIGRISETSFGWRDAKSEIPLNLLANASVSDADVLVVGDSFSNSYAWQSTLAAIGLRVTTAHWDDVGGTVCADFRDWASATGFRGNVVIFEIVERTLRHRLTEAKACAAMSKPFKARAPATASPRAEPPGFALNTEAKIATGIATFRNTRRIAHAQEEVILRAPDWGNRPLVSAREVPDGCAQFSHRLCNKALFLLDDALLPAPSAEDVRTMAAINAALAPLKVVWMVVPNKTTVYANPEHASDFAQALSEAQLGPDLFELAQALRLRIKDLYLPNDTHWSPTGQIAFGSQVLRWLDAAGLLPPLTIASSR